MSKDHPLPSAGGSYLRDDQTGDLTVVASPEDELATAADAVPEIDTAEPTVDPETPAEEV